MDTEIIVAIIGGLATVVAAIIGISRLKNKKSDTTSTGTLTKSAALSIEGSAVAISGDFNRVSFNPLLEKKHSDVRIVDISFDESTGEFPKLDIKIRNTGDEPAFLKKVIFEVSHVFVPIEFRSISFHHQAVSWEYDLQFTGQPGLIECPISQVVQPDGTDRFVFKLGQDCGPVDLPIIVRFSIQIIYNEDNNSVTSDYYICTVPRAVEVYGSYIATASEKEMWWNIEQIAKFSNLSGILSQGAQSQIQHVLERKRDRQEERTE